MTVSKELMGEALAAFTAVFGQAPGLQAGVEARVIVAQWHSLFCDTPEAQFRAMTRQALTSCTQFPVPADLLALRTASAPVGG